MLGGVGQSFVKQSSGTRTLRAQKNVMKCPSCTNDISDFVKNPQVNKELMDVIESLQKEMKEDDMETDDLHEESDITDEALEFVEIEMNCEDAGVEIINTDTVQESDGADDKSK